MWCIENMLSFILFFPLFGFFLVLCIPARHEKILKLVALNSACLSFSGSLILWAFFNKSTSSFQFVLSLGWWLDRTQEIILGIDGISLFFILLTTLLVPLCLLASWDSVSFNLKDFLLAFLALDFILILSFCTLDLFIFYICFESTLIPMFLMIGIWGSRERKVLAAYYFFMYTFAGSVLMLLAILHVSNITHGHTTYEVLVTYSFSAKTEATLFFPFFFAFASKVPMIPFHLWLPEAHVEAPTAGSVLLAGILLKLGTYGFIRFTLPIIPYACFYFTPIVYTIAVIGLVFTSFTAIRQTDFKRIIAYTSIAHMNLVVLGIFSQNVLGIEGALLQSLSHGFVASGLFLVIGVVYDRYKTRIVQYYGGLAITMPIYTIVFLFFTLANIGFPGTSSFVGEFLILLGVFDVNTTVAFFGSTGVIISSMYSLWLFNRIVYGNIKIREMQYFLDLSIREFVIFLPLMLGTFIVGLCPNFFLDSMHISVSNLVETTYLFKF